MKLIIHTEDNIKTFDNVIKLEGFMALDCFTNKIVIYHQNKKTVIKQYEINYIEVVC